VFDDDREDYRCPYCGKVDTNVGAPTCCDAAHEAWRKRWNAELLESPDRDISGEG
jgi:hypothetical protein